MKAFGMKVLMRHDFETHGNLKRQLACMWTLNKLHFDQCKNSSSGASALLWIKEAI